MTQKKIWLLSGVPGSGKSFWAREQIAKYGGVHCSRDEIRFALLKEGEDYFAHEEAVIRLWREKIADAINDPKVENVYVDATNLTEMRRKEVIDNFPAGNYEIIIVIFDMSLETCIKQNELREGRALVPRSVIRRMNATFERTTSLGDETIVFSDKEEIE